MIFRALDTTGDWQFGRGRQNYLTREKAIERNIETRLKQFLGNCFFATDEGVDWLNLLGGKNKQGIVIQCRKVILDSYGVVKINSIDPVINATTRGLTVRYSIDTFYTRRLNGAVQVS